MSTKAIDTPIPGHQYQKMSRFLLKRLNSRAQSSEFRTSTGASSSADSFVGCAPSAGAGEPFTVFVFVLPLNPRVGTSRSSVGRHVEALARESSVIRCGRRRRVDVLTVLDVPQPNSFSATAASSGMLRMITRRQPLAGVRRGVDGLVCSSTSRCRTPLTFSCTGRQSDG